MSFDYGSMQDSITALIEGFGFLITLSTAAGTTAKAYAAWGKVEKVDIAPSMSETIGERRVLYVAGNIKIVPEVGNVVIEGSNTYIINAMQVYKPAKKVVAYKLMVSS